jgi:hypothetical protein
MAYEAGKGGRPRPFSISQEEYGNRLDSIFGVKPKKERYVPPPLPDTVQQTENKDNQDGTNLQ